jgi:bifunctional non-homologous end joining protein LigD
MAMSEYRKKRRFAATPEPRGKETSAKHTGARLVYAVQKHRASRLHYDFRLEWKGGLLSWAIPKGPSLDPSIKRLAMQVEDHPIEDAKFEGVIPEGEYGAGTVMLWDTGAWEPEQGDVDEALRKGDFKFTLHGQKLNGSWVLVRTRGYGSTAGRSSWLLIKHRDRFASREDVTETKPYSSSTRRSLVDIARDEGGDAEKAATGDPVKVALTRRRAAVLARKRRASS